MRICKGILIIYIRNRRTQPETTAKKKTCKGVSSPVSSEMLAIRRPHSVLIPTPVTCKSIELSEGKGTNMLFLINKTDWTRKYIQFNCFHIRIQIMAINSYRQSA
jgi:hypothetical protein